MFVIIFILGLTLSWVISNEFLLGERLALSFPLGFGMASCLMFGITVAGIPLQLMQIEATFSLFAVVFAGFALVREWKLKRLTREFIVPKLNFRSINLVWVVFAAAIGYLVWGITRKCLYWPPAEFDTILGYDLLSKAIAREGTLANSILTNKTIVEQCGPRLLYPPLLAFSNSLCYFTGMETPKLINSLFFISWVGLFYSLSRRLVNATNAIFFTLLVVIIPEMFAHASFSLTNLPCAIYSCSAVMAFVIWYEKKLEGFFYLSIFLMAFAVWTRSDAVMFIGAILAVLAWYSYRTKTYKFLLQYLVALVPFVAWNLYSKSYIPRDQTGFFIKKIFFDGDKLGKVLSSAWGIMSSSNIYGLTFYIFIIGLLVNVMAIIKRDKWELLSIFFIALTGYTMLFYQMSDADGSLFPPGGWMQSGYKRGLFCYAPLALFYVSVSKYVSLGFDKLHQRLNLFAKS